MNTSLFLSGSDVQLEARGIQAWIPVIGQHKAERTTFTYDEQSDTYTCFQSKSLRRLEVRMAKGSTSAFYYAKPSDCQPCPFKQACCGKRRYKSLSMTVFRNAYQRMRTRQQSLQGIRM